MDLGEEAPGEGRHLVAGPFLQGGCGVRDEESWRVVVGVKRETWAPGTGYKGGSCPQGPAPPSLLLVLNPLGDWASAPQLSNRPQCRPSNSAEKT